MRIVFAFACVLVLCGCGESPKPVIVVDARTPDQIAAQQILDEAEKRELARAEESRHQKVLEILEEAGEAKLRKYHTEFKALLKAVADGQVTADEMKAKKKELDDKVLNGTF